MPRQPKPWWRKERKAWYARVGGKQVRLAETHKEALAQFRRLMLDEGKSPPSDLTVAELCDLFQGHAERTLKPTTCAWYALHLQSFIYRHGALKAAKVRPAELTGWAEDEHSRKVRRGDKLVTVRAKWSPSTRRGAITAIKRVWAWGVEQGHLGANPLAKVRRPPMGRRKVMAADEAVKVLAAIRPGSPLADFVAGLAETGCRPGELAGVEAKDIRPGSVTVRGKTGERTVYPSPAAEELLNRLAKARPTGRLFLNSRGKPWDRNALRCAFRKLRARTGVEGAVPYAFRHLYASLAIERGVDPLTLSELMGHKDVSMLKDFYVRHREESLRRAAAQATTGALVTPASGGNASGSISRGQPAPPSTPPSTARRPRSR